MTLSEDQQHALDKIISFLSSDKQAFVLRGYAGTGKTTLMNYLVKYLNSNGDNFTLCAPTHRAKAVLREKTKQNVITVHKLLSLSPIIDIYDLDYKQLKFNSAGSDEFPFRSLIIIDEASMITNDLFRLLSLYCESSNSKLLFIGDPAQLKGVNEQNISKVFTLEDGVTLSKIHRQEGDSELLPVLEVLRDKSLNSFEESKNLIVNQNIKEFVKKYCIECKIGIDAGVTTHTKLLAYTNSRVQSYNACIRKFLFKDSVPQKYHVGEILMAFENFGKKEPKFCNSSDYIIKSCEEAEKSIDIFVLKGYDMVLYDSIDDIDMKVFILDEDKNEEILPQLAKTIEDIRINAIQSKKEKKYKYAKSCWVEYFTIMGSFAITKDLLYQKRVVKPKTFDYGYAITVHKSQGSSFNNVFIDIDNLSKCREEETKRQLQYVGLSRTETVATIFTN